MDILGCAVMVWTGITNRRVRASSRLAPFKKWRVELLVMLTWNCGQLMLMSRIYNNVVIVGCSLSSLLRSRLCNKFADRPENCDTYKIQVRILFGHIECRTSAVVSPLHCAAYSSAAISVPVNAPTRSLSKRSPTILGYKLMYTNSWWPLAFGVAHSQGFVC